MRFVRIGLAALAVLLLAAAVALWQAPQFLDWNHYRSAVEHLASLAVGRPVRIRGAIHVSLLPQATLTAAGVSVADTGDGASAAAGELRLRISLSALLEGRIKPQDVTLDHPVVQLPWPLTALSLREGPPPGGLHAAVEDGTLAIGGVKVTGIDGELRVDPATGTLAASGLATVLEQRWRITARLSTAGSDGSSPLSLSLDGQGPGVGTGGALTGQIGADGGLSGQVTGRGPDLSLLLPAPPLAWHGGGRLLAMGGLVVADDLDLDIGGAPARGAVSLRFLPPVRLDAALATSRLDLDAWLPPLLRGERTPLPTGIDLSAEAASLRGGTLRQLRAGFDLTAGGVDLRQAEALLPGDAPAALAGTLTSGHFTGAGRIVMPDAAQTLAWLRPLAPALAALWPVQAVHQASAEATVNASAGSLALGSLRGEADGVPLSGSVAVTLGARPALAASLQLDGASLDGVLPAGPPSLPQAGAWLAGVGQRVAGFDADLDIAVTKPRWQGQAYDRAALALSCQGGVLTARQLLLSGPAGTVSASGVVGAGGALAQGRLEASVPDAGVVRLPPALAMLDGVLRGPGSLTLSAAGPPASLALSALADAGDARLQLNGKLDLAGPHFGGAVSLQHPGAPRLLQALGLPGAAGWVGEGSLSLQATASVDPHGAALTGLALSAGLVRLSGDFSVASGPRPSITARLRADSLPVPLPPWRSAEPLDFGWLDDMDATLAVQAGQVLWNGDDPGQPGQAAVTLVDGQLSADVRLPVAGGVFAGRLTAAGRDAPRLSAAGTLTGAVIDSPVFGSAIDLASGKADVSVDLTATGHSPAAMLATLAGSASATVRAGALSGLDAGAIVSALRAYQPGTDVAALSAAIGQALHGGTTAFDQLTAHGNLANGIASIDNGVITSAAGTLDVTGPIDAPDGTAGVRIVLQPAIPGPAARVAVRLTGPAGADPTVDLSGLAAWLSTP